MAGTLTLGTTGAIGKKIDRAQRVGHRPDTTMVQSTLRMQARPLPLRCQPR